MSILLIPRPHGEHPVGHLHGYAGILQAHAYAAINQLYEDGRQPGPFNDHNIHNLDRLFPWNWKVHPARLAA
jgi:hypothetical protein